MAVSLTDGDRQLLIEAARNPLIAGLVALALNQLAYRFRLWDPRPSADGKYRTWKRTWGLDRDGLHLGDATYAVVDPEEIASQNATIIGTAILAGMALAAAKAPVVQVVKA